MKVSLQDFVQVCKGIIRNLINVFRNMTILPKFNAENT